MDYFPFFFRLAGARVLIIGGGEVAARKVQLLARARIVPLVVAKNIGREIAAVVAELGGACRTGDYSAADLRGCRFVVAATDDDKLNRRVVADCRKRGVPVNVVDCPALCDFIFPALIDRAPLVVAVSSSAKSPVLARHIRNKIESALPANIGKMADFCESWRGRVKQWLSPPRRRLFWEKIIGGATANAVLAGDIRRAEKFLNSELKNFAAASAVGEVSLIGAGPGNPDLFTFRGQQLLQQADVVVYDRLVSKQIVELARRDAQRIFVGKTRNRRVMTQENINRLLIDLATAGNKVARLKGGDPFIFGRGGEEMLALRAAGVPFNIVPGVSAANGAAAFAGIPLTHRGIARAVRFVAAGDGDPHYWRRLARDDATLVFYMAGAKLSELSKNLILGGRAPHTPVAVISAATTAAQQITAATLSTVCSRIDKSPSLLIVGDVVRLHDSLKWFSGNADGEFPFSTLPFSSDGEKINDPRAEQIPATAAVIFNSKGDSKNGGEKDSENVYADISKNIPLSKNVCARAAENVAS